MEFEFKKIATPDNIGRLAELMDSSYDLNVDASYFKWKYFDNPAGPAIAYEALYNGKTVSFYSIIPEFYWIDGVIKKTYQAVDAMTHPDFQRKGLFVKLAQMVFRDALLLDKDLLTIGFSAPVALAGHLNKLNWKLIHISHYIFLPNILFSIRNFNKSNNKPGIIEFTEMNDMLSNYLETIQPHTKVSKVLNKDLFCWRIFNNPRISYKVIGMVNSNELIGICVYRVDYKNTCLINWLHFKDTMNYKMYTSDFLQYIFKETKIRYIYTWSSKAPFLSDTYKKCGFLTNPFNKGPFHSKLPFTNYQQGLSTDSANKNFDNYDFQPIMLD